MDKNATFLGFAVFVETIKADRSKVINTKLAPVFYVFKAVFKMLPVFSLKGNINSKSSQFKHTSAVRFLNGHFPPTLSKMNLLPLIAEK